MKTVGLIFLCIVGLFVLACLLYDLFGNPDDPEQEWSGDSSI
jgi:hypothetical protein